MSLASLENRGFIVTGRDDLLVRSVVVKAAQRGAWILVCAPPDGEPGCAAIMDDAQAVGVGERVSCFTADLSREEEADRLFDAAGERLPPLWCLISGCDDAEGAEQSLVNLSLDEWEGSAVETLRTAFLVSRRGLYELVAGGKGGRIIYWMTGRSGAGGLAVRSTLQNAMRALCRSVTKEYGRQEITCNLVVAQAPAPDGDGRLTDAADSILFLASDEAAFVNGEMIVASAAICGRDGASRIGVNHIVEG